MNKNFPHSNSNNEKTNVNGCEQADLKRIICQKQAMNEWTNEVTKNNIDALENESIQWKIGFG